ncbi:PspA/IM30 family protein [Neobacillus terrae]|uniref:PspA/IM30 family protein n=1 Tax=Neobacillus terrae TaxID=3034837 RepID=UPI00140DD2D4|nr:PspA/IM30 family protein [Neobacillus terrae]NHM30783.1 hypothetical protein [Neobacillus terrae]
MLNENKGNGTGDCKRSKGISQTNFCRKKQETLITETKALVEKRTRQAKLAIDQGEEEIAKLAVQEKLTHEKQLSLYQGQLESIKEQTKIILEKLEQLKVTYQQMQQKKIILASRANVAQSMKQIQKATVSFQSDSIAR